MKKSLKQKFAVFIFGPTGVGKSAFAERLAIGLQQAQIVNCDLGQFYTSLSVGVAKPDYKSSKIKQHLFDIIDEPVNFTVSQYRELVLNKIDEIWQENDIPILVGGSGFYLKSLFFPPATDIEISCSGENGNDYCKNTKSEEICDKDLWDFLNKIDPDRAQKIDANDTYRLKRALDLWEKTGRKPSEFEPEFKFPSNFILIFLNKDRSDLYSQIDLRADQMVQEGWIDEVWDLINSKNGKEWEDFLKKKKLIGYDLIIDFINSELPISFDLLMEQIKQKTRNYAKRQITFWRSLEKQLKKEVEKNKYTNKVETGSIATEYIESRVEEFNQVAGQVNDFCEKKLLAYLERLF